jgi:hypothetical protein
MDAEDVAQIVQSLRDALSAAADRPPQVLDEFGWFELLDDEPQVAVSALFALRGELLIPGSALDGVMLAASGLSGLPDRARVVLPPLGTHRPSSAMVHGGDTVEVAGVLMSGDTPVLVPLLTADGELGFALCDAIPLIPGDGIDPSAGWGRVSATVAVRASFADLSSVEQDPGVVWDRMVAAGRRALSHELTAVCGAMKAMTVEHVRSREQFGQALGSFQAVKHQLADVHLWHEIAVLSTNAAWEDNTPASAALAKAAAVRSSRAARAVCQQLLGGMGFTWEHDFHRYLRRALTLEPLLGGTADLHTEIGAALRSGAIDDSVVPL